MSHALGAHRTFPPEERHELLALACHLITELAAARTRILSPQAILARLGSRLAFLGGGARDLPARQQTLRGAIDWSYELLNPAEQVLLRRLSVFAGGASLEAIEAVCDPSALRIEALEGLTALVDQSLLRSAEATSDALMNMMMLITPVT